MWFSDKQDDYRMTNYMITVVKDSKPCQLVSNCWYHLNVKHEYFFLEIIHEQIWNMSYIFILD